MKVTVRKKDCLIRNKHFGIRDVLIERIQTGVYKEKLPSVVELSDEFKVNPITVRKSLRALEMANLISIQQRAGCFIKRKMRIGYVSLQDDETVNRIHSLGYMRVMDGIKFELEQKYNSSLSVFTDRDLESKNFHIRLKNEVDGCIVLAGVAVHYEHIFTEVPHVTVMGSSGLMKNVVQITYDDSKIASLVADFLLAKQLSKVIYFGRPDAESRTSPLKKILKKAGVDFVSVDCDYRILCKEAVFECAKKSLIKELRQSGVNQCGIYLSCDEIAPLIYQALYSENITPQTEVPIVSVNNNIYLREVVCPSLASVDLQLFEIGQKAVSVLSEIIHNPKQVPNKIELFEPRLV